MTEATHGFVIRAACGCVVGLLVDNADARTYKSLGGMMRENDSVQHLPIEECRQARPLYKRALHKDGACPERAAQPTLPGTLL